MNYKITNGSVSFGADTILEDVKNLIDKYNLNIGIVDTSSFNKILIEPEKNKVK